MTTIKKEGFFDNFWRKRYYKNMFTGGGLACIPLIFFLLICAIWPKSEPFVGQYWIAYMIGSLMGLAASFWIQSYWNEYQRVKYREMPDDKEVWYSLFGGIVALIIAAILLAFKKADNTLFAKIIEIAILCGACSVLGLLVHLGKIVFKKNG